MEHMGGEPADAKLAGLDEAGNTYAPEGTTNPTPPTCKFCGAEREIIEDPVLGQREPRYIFKMCVCMGTGYIRSGAIGERRDY